MSLKTIIGNLRWWAFYCERGGQGCYAAPSLRDAADILENINKRGKWICNKENASIACCSECGYGRPRYTDYYGPSATNYCPNCGTKMDQEE